MKKYVKTFGLGLQSSMEYRFDFFISILSTVFPMLMQYFLWTAIFSNSAGRVIYGYTYQQILVYTFLAGIVSKLVAGGFEWEVSGDIKEGGLNKFIVKPIGYFQYRISYFLGQKSLQFAILLVIQFFILFMLNRYMGTNFSIQRIELFLLALILAIILNFLIVFCISTAAFWLGETWGLFVVSNIVVNIISGGIFPLDIFGEGVLRIIKFLPFTYTVYYPVNILNGKLETSMLLEGTVIQCIWILVLAVAANLLWNTGSKKYIAAGG